jgi:hypothetical protein
MGNVESSTINETNPNPTVCENVDQKCWLGIEEEFMRQSYLGNREFQLEFNRSEKDEVRFVAESYGFDLDIKYELTGTKIYATFSFPDNLNYANNPIHRNYIETNNFRNDNPDLSEFMSVINQLDFEIARAENQGSKTFDFCLSDNESRNEFVKRYIEEKHFTWSEEERPGYFKYYKVLEITMF